MGDRESAYGKGGLVETGARSACTWCVMVVVQAVQNVQAAGCKRRDTGLGSVLGLASTEEGVGVGWSWRRALSGVAAPCASGSQGLPAAGAHVFRHSALSGGAGPCAACGRAKCSSSWCKMASS